MLEFVAEERQRCECLCAVWSVYLYNSVVRFVTDEQTVAPWDGACFDIEVENLDSDDDEDDDLDSDDDEDDD
jgi:hypothetical protein